MRSFLDHVPLIKFSRPSIKLSKTASTYVCESEQQKMRDHAEIIGLHCTSKSFLVLNRAPQLRFSSLASRLHRYSHTLYKGMVEILKREGRTDTDNTATCEEIVEAFLI